MKIGKRKTENLLKSDIYSQKIEEMLYNDHKQRNIGEDKMHSETLVMRTKETKNVERIILEKQNNDSYSLESTSQRKFYDHYPTEKEIVEFTNITICEDDWYLGMIEV